MVRLNRSVSNLKLLTLVLELDGSCFAGEISVEVVS